MTALPSRDALLACFDSVRDRIAPAATHAARAVINADRRAFWGFGVIVVFVLQSPFGLEAATSSRVTRVVGSRTSSETVARAYRTDGGSPQDSAEYLLRFRSAARRRYACASFGSSTSIS